MKRELKYVLLTFLLVSCGQRAVPFKEIEINPKHKGNISFFLLAGQSNMSGRGSIENYRVEIDSSIYLYGNDYKWHYGQEPLDNECGQIDECSLDENPGIGPALSFAKQLTNFDSSLIIGLVPCAKGGSSIVDWQKKMGANNLYHSLIKRADSVSKYGTISGVLFYQGERDANSSYVEENDYGLPNSWASYFEQFVYSVRKDLGNDSLPVFMAEIGKTTNKETYGYWDEIKKQQEQIDLSHVYHITTENLNFQDHVHLSPESYLKLGGRFANSFIEYTKNKE